ncbi:TPA: hypothetical protein ACH3X1_012931 [Trebouxia sp. C0004]
MQSKKPLAPSESWFLLAQILKLFIIQVGGSRQYDRESTNWTDSTLPSSDSFGLGDPYSAAEDSPEALLSSLGRSMDSLPPEMSYSLKQGIMSTELLQRWLHWEQRYLLRQLLRFPGTPVLASGCVKIWFHANVCRQHAQTVTI